MADIGKYIVSFASAKKRKQLAEERASKAQAELLNALGLQKSASTVYGNERITATKVESVSVVIDSDRLKKEIGATKFNKVCTLSLDKAKLEDAIVRGEIDANTVAMCSQEVPKAAYIRLTSKETTEKPKVAKKPKVV